MTQYGAASPAERREKAALEARNKRVAGDFHDALFNRKDVAAARAHLAAPYVEHDPEAGDGADGVAARIERLRREAPDLRAEVVRAVADGEHVILHSRVREGKGERSAMDVYRLADGKVAEHWAVRQAVPEHALNTNTMF